MEDGQACQFSPRFFVSDAGGAPDPPPYPAANDVDRALEVPKDGLLALCSNDDSGHIRRINRGVEELSPGQL